MSKKQMLRLQEFVNPENYKITIEPSKDMNSYQGVVQIKAKITKPTKDIILHSKDLTIRSTTICLGNQCLLPKLKEDKDNESIKLENNKEITGEIEIHIEFNGKIEGNLIGLYKSKYEHNGKDNYLLTTQCEAPYARKIFPCFDEPNKKATFDLTVTIEKNLVAISNMPSDSEKIDGEKKKITFKTSPKMSSYLFYLGIGNFEFKESKYRDVKIRIVTTPGKSKNTSFAMEHTKRYLEYFEKYSGINYPLEKLDMIAIPDFAAGAMENWGAITFREILLLVDEGKTSVAIKKRAAEVIAHELWHQWSGNLVTMDWWNDLWLNESFATYMAYKAVADYKPEWKVWNDYVSGELATGLFKDSLKTTHPIEVEINNPDEIEEVFDEISYDKGGCVLRMLENYIGEEFFRQGVSHYLKKYSYSNSKASNLWEAIAEVSKNNKIKSIMKSWISEPGHPLISIEKTINGTKISQKRLNKETSQSWLVPLSILVNKEVRKYLLEKKEEIYKLKDDIKVNYEHFGFYRTKYSKDLLANLGKMIKNKQLNDFDRLGAENDLWALCNISEETVENYLRFMENYLEETDYTILSEILGSIKKLDRIYYYEPWWPKTKEKITKKFLPLYKKQLQKLTWNKMNGESFEDSLMRNLAINYCGFANDSETINEAKRRFDSKEFDLDIANAIYTIISINGNKKDFDNFLSRYNKEKDVESQLKLLSALYRFRDEKLLINALDLALTDKVRMQNLIYVFGESQTNPTSQKVLFNWVKKNWLKLEKYSESHYTFKAFINSLVISQVNSDFGKEIRKFFKDNKVKYEMTQNNAFEAFEQNLKFIEKNREFLKNY